MKEVSIFELPVPENGYCLIKTTVQTLDYDSWRYRNNTIEMPIPWQVAIDICKAWTDPKHKCSQVNIVARYFGKNQEGYAGLYIPKEFSPNGKEVCIAGTQNCTKYDQQDDTFRWHDPADDLEDDEEEE